MKNVLLQDEIDFYFEILKNEYNYEKIKDCALILMKGKKQSFNIIKGECKIIFNPYRVMFFERLGDEGLEHFFDVEVIWGDVEPIQQKNFKKAFVIALDEMVKVNYFNNEN